MWFLFFSFRSCILADEYCTWHHQTCSQVQLYYCWFILPCLQNICGGACGSALLLVNISVCLVLNTKEVVRPVSAAIQNQNSQFCFKNLTTSLFFFSNFFHNLPNARCRISCHPFQNLISFWLEAPSTTPLSNSEIEIFHSFFRTFLLCEVNFIMTYVMAGVHLPSPS